MPYPERVLGADWPLITLRFANEQELCFLGTPDGAPASRSHYTLALPVRP